MPKRLVDLRSQVRRGFAAEAGGALTLFSLRASVCRYQPPTPLPAPSWESERPSDHHDRATSERIRCSSWMSARDK